MLILAGLLGALAGQTTPPPPRNGLKSFGFAPPAQNVKLWLPQPYEADPRISQRYIRVPTVSSPEVVMVRLEFKTEKQPEPPRIPLEADLMKADATLANIKFTGSLANWRGRPVASARYEGFVQGGFGVYGRMAWLPLEPGTVVVNLYAEPTWSAAMNQDWDVILANLEGPIAELTLRERAPTRWAVSKVLSVLGGLVALAGLVLILARMAEALGGTVVYLGLMIPVVPLGYAFLHLHECWRGLLVFFTGVGLIGTSMLLER